MSVYGWGVVVALVVGGLAYLGVVQGIRASRRESAVSDGRQRWWTALTWVWDNRTDLERSSAVAALEALRESAETSTQALMLRTVAVNVLSPAQPRPSSPSALPDGQGDPAAESLLLDRIGDTAAGLAATGL